jgi:hypothetical protein
MTNAFQSFTRFILSGEVRTSDLLGVFIFTETMPGWVYHMEHEIHFRTLLQWLRDFRSKVSKEKSYRSKNKLGSWGLCGAVPTKAKNVRVFLGAMHFYRRYMK